MWSSITRSNGCRTLIRRGLSVTGTALLLASCAAFSPDGGMQPVTKFASNVLGKDAIAFRNELDERAARGTVERLLKRPLTPDAAVQVALLNNRGLQAAYNELGIAEAAKVGASLPPNPTISLMRISGSAEIEIERKIIVNILALATLPMRTELAADRFRQAQLRAIAETMRTAADARRAYYRTVAAREIVAFLTDAQTAAGTAAQLAKRLGESGAMNKLDQAREQVFYADVAALVATSRQRAESERESLVRILGLWGNGLEVRLASRVPALPRRPRALPAIERDAVARRADLQIARIELDLLAKSYGLTQATRFVNLLDVARISKTTSPAEAAAINQIGPEIEFQIPIFDFGEVRVREAEQTYTRAVNQLIDKAVRVRSEAREAYGGYRAAYDIAAHYQHEILPLRKIISDETLLRYNAMQIDVFSLLAEVRQRVSATTAAINARRDFWLADINLQMATVGGSPAVAGGEPAMAALATGGESGAH